MAVNSFTSNQGTQTPILTDNTGGTAGTIIPIFKMSMDGQGTYTNGNLFTGTLPQVNNIGTIPNLPGGTLNLATVTGNLGTVGTVGLATITGNIGTVGTLGLGSVVVNTLPNLPGGTINAATISGNLGTIGTIGLATITGNIGTIGTLGLGTVVGFASSGATLPATAYPMVMAGTSATNGTVFGMLVDSSGRPQVVVQVGTINSLPNIPGGTINAATISGNIGTIGTIGLATVAGNIGVSSGTLNVGTINTGTFVMPSGTLTVIPNIPGGTIGSVVGIGSVSGLSNLPGGSITVTTGTVNTGTINSSTVNVGSFSKISPAAIAGSFTAAGTITQAGSQFDTTAFDIGGTWVGTVFTEGQIGTSSWFAIPYITNLGASGTSFTGNGDYFVDSGGLDGVRARLTYSSGTLTYNSRQSAFESPIMSVFGGSIGNVGVLNAGTISTLPNLPGGSIVVTAGTTIQTAGTVNTGTVNTGTINVATVTAGTINTGTVNVGTINVATITAGTINTGTFRGDARTTQNIVTFGTQVGFSGAAAATIVGSTSVGAGTSLWMNDVSIFNLQSGAGTFILGFGTAQQGTNILLRAPIGTNSAVGIEKSYPKAVNAGMTNQDLVLSATGAGTVDLSISYFISA